VTATRACDALVFVTATNTEIGKTWWAAAVAGDLRARGCSVVARKPAQSYAPDDISTDADVLAVATGESSDDVCPPHRRYPLPLAPPMAAEALERAAFTIADLDDEIGWTGHRDVALVEGAGGPRSPLASDGDNVDLARLLRPSTLLLVADAGLGTINSVRCCAGALSLLPVVVALNRYVATDDLHVRNRLWLSERYGYDVVTDPAALADRLASSLTVGRRPEGRPRRGTATSESG
jgi:dethiobiotin synthetase